MCTQGILQNAESLCALKVYYANAALSESTLLNAYYRNTLLRHGLSFCALVYGLIEQDELESYSFFVHSTHTTPTGYHSLVHFDVYSYIKSLVALVRCLLSFYALIYGLVAWSFLIRLL